MSERRNDVPPKWQVGVLGPVNIHGCRGLTGGSAAESGTGLPEAASCAEMTGLGQAATA